MNFRILITRAPTGLRLQLRNSLFGRRAVAGARGQQCQARKPEGIVDSDCLVFGLRCRAPAMTLTSLSHVALIDKIRGEAFAVS